MSTFFLYQIWYLSTYVTDFQKCILTSHILKDFSFKFFQDYAMCLQITSPACTELEVAMMDWLGKLIQLPQEFLNCSDGPGGGVIQVLWFAGRTIDDN
jgi:hypothetical protein